MSELHFEILDSARQKVFNKLKSFAREGVLGGGTAVSLLLDHRKSYDFDIFMDEPIEKKILKDVQKIFGEQIKLLVDNEDELSFLTPEEVKVSFIYFPFKPLHKIMTSSPSAGARSFLARVRSSFVTASSPTTGRRGIRGSEIKTTPIPIFDIKDLASNKAYVLGRRGEYRDYVDLFFLLKAGLKLERVVREAQERFKGAFSEKLFLEQLVYLKDLKDFTVEFTNSEYSPNQISDFFKKTVAEYTKVRLQL